MVYGNQLVSPHQGTTDDDETPYDKEMQDKLANFMNDANLDSDDDDDDDVDDDFETKRELHIPDSLPEQTLDHVLLATNNLEEGMALFEDLTGLKPTKVGALRGAGTKSARVSLNQSTFVEIIAPDDNAKSEGMAPALLKLPSGQLHAFHYAVRAKPDDVYVPDDMGWDRDAIVMVYANPDDFDESGDVYKWDLVFLYGHGLGGCVPAFVNWRQNKYHPTSRLPQTGAKIQSVQVQAPSGHYAHTLLKGVRGIDLSSGSSTKLTISLSTPDMGVVSFSGSNPQGIVMPGYGDMNHPSMNRRM